MPIGSVLEAVGNVPLIQLKMMSSRNVFAKAEFVNPGGSMKGRVAKRIIESAEEIGKLKPGMIILNK
jgi:cysteine synthase